MNHGRREEVDWQMRPERKSVQNQLRRAMQTVQDEMADFGHIHGVHCRSWSTVDAVFYYYKHHSPLLRSGSLRSRMDHHASYVSLYSVHFTSFMDAGDNGE